MSEEDKKETAKKAVKTPKTKEVKAVTAKKKSVKTTKKSVKEVEIPLVDEEVKDKAIPKEIKTDEISEENLVKEEKGDEIIEENLVEEKNRVEPFDWEEAVKDDIYSVEERADLEKEYTSTLTEIIDKQVLDGTVVTITDREVVVDINFKSDGVISFNEFKYNLELKVGDTVEVLVEKQEDKNGQLVLSHRRARVLRAWEKVNDALETGEVVNGQILSRTKGGMIVDVFGIECFLPGSQIDVKPIRDYDDYVGKKMEFKIVKVNAL